MKKIASAIMVFLTFSMILELPRSTHATPAGKYFDNIVIIAMENRAYTNIVGNTANAPFINSMVSAGATLGSQFDDYHSSTGVSISDGCSAACYTVFSSGNRYGISDCGSQCGPSYDWTLPISDLTILDSLNSAELTWQAYAEGASGSGTCNFDPPRHADHFAFLHFKSLDTTANCANFLATSSSTDSEFISAANSASPPAFLWLTPTDSHNMHDTTVSDGDTWLKGVLVGSSGSLSNPQSGTLFSSSLFHSGRRVLFLLWWDEHGCSGTDCSGSGGAPEIFYSFGVKRNFVASITYHHDSILRFVEDNWNLNALSTYDAAAIQPGSEIVRQTTLGSMGFHCALYSCTFSDVTTSPSTFTMDTNGTAEFNQINTSTCSYTNSYYDTVKRGSFPWGSTYGRYLPPDTIQNISMAVSFLSRTLGNPNGCSDGGRYHIFLALYYHLSGNSGTQRCDGGPDFGQSKCFAGTVGGTTRNYNWLDTQVRVENIGGVDSAIVTNCLSSCTHDPGNAFGWYNATLQLSPGGTAELIANINHQCAEALAASNVGSGVSCTFEGVEYGTEGYSFNSVRTNFHDVSFGADALYREDWADFDNDGAVDIVDAATLASYFGRTCSTLSAPDQANCHYWDFSNLGSPDITSAALLAYYFDQRFPSALPVPPSQAYAMAAWKSNGYCGFLLTTSSFNEQAYCNR